MMHKHNTLLLSSETDPKSCLGNSSSLSFYKNKAAFQSHQSKVLYTNRTINTLFHTPLRFPLNKLSKRHRLRSKKVETESLKTLVET
ncbi:unnamed protein product [Arctogadus glacialis]